MGLPGPDATHQHRCVRRLSHAAGRGQGTLRADLSSRQADEAVEHALAAGFLEIDLELVALDLGDLAIAELGVEDALADGDVGAAGIAEADRAGARLEDARRGALERAARRGAAPAGAAAGAAADVGEGVGALRPVGAPQRLAAA